MLTERTRFSPRKLRISTSVPSLAMLMLIGKWAYTSRILYSKPCTWQTQFQSISQHAPYIKKHLRPSKVDSQVVLALMEQNTCAACRDAVPGRQQCPNTMQQCLYDQHDDPAKEDSNVES